jgi:hypothetical protein
LPSTMRNHFKLGRMVQIKSEIQSVGKDMAKSEPLDTARGTVKRRWATALENSLMVPQQFTTKLSIPLYKSVHTKSCPWVFIPTLFHTSTQ